MIWCNAFKFMCSPDGGFHLYARHVAITTSVQRTEEIRLCLSSQIFWLRDGEPLNVADETNFIISNDGNLIISQTRLRDAGNYSCGAQNVVGRRLSDPARLSVYGIYLLALSHTMTLGGFTLLLLRTNFGLRTNFIW